MRDYTLIMPVPCLSRGVIERIAEDRKARYVGDSQIPVKPDWTPENIVWSDQAVSLFWQDEPPGDYSNVFCVFRRSTSTAEAGALVIHAGNKFDGIVQAIYTSDKSRICTYSAHTHDYHALNDSVFIDGGRNYKRTLGSPDRYKHGTINLYTDTLFDEDGEAIGKVTRKYKGW